jgi:hypothetical protein
MTETWKAVPGYEGYYEVSDLGHVRSLDRVVEVAADTFRGMHLRKLKGRLIRRQKCHSGISSVVLSLGGVRTPFTVAELVLAAFLGPKPDGTRAQHIGSTGDDRFSNLCYSLPSAQNAKLAEHEIQTILSLKGSSTEIASFYGVTRGTINHVKQGRTWQN